MQTLGGDHGTMKEKSKYLHLMNKQKTWFQEYQKKKKRLNKKLKG